MFITIIPFFQIAREHGIKFMETSAKANINIDAAFMQVAESILEKTAGKETEVVDRVPLAQSNNKYKGCCWICPSSQ